jgi:hypothetical protein
MGGAGGAVFGFIFAVLCGFYAWRIWTRRAKRLTIFLIFRAWRLGLTGARLAQPPRSVRVRGPGQSR